MLVALCISALPNLSSATEWEDIIEAEMTCCNPVDDADICAETTGGTGCVWLEYGISDNIDSMINVSDSQCVGAEYYRCRMEMGTEFCGGNSSFLDFFDNSIELDLTCGSGEPMPNCMLGLNYAFEGVACRISGDLRTTMWNGGHHNFEGQPDTYTTDGTSLKNQYYYVAPCSDRSAVDVPVSILGTHSILELGDNPVLDYLVLELHDRLYEATATYNIYLSSSFASYAARDTDGVSTEHDHTKAAAPNALTTINSGTTTAIGYRFSALLSIDETTDSTTLELTVDNDHTITVFIGAMDYVLIQQAQAYKCASCGLCGNFKNTVDMTAETQQLERCDGSMVAFHTGDDTDVPELYDPDGWTWEKNFFENECASANTSTIQYNITNNNGDDFEFVASCDEMIQPYVDLECEDARDELAVCCDSMGDICDALLSDCKTDVCVMATVDGVGDFNLIQPAIESAFVEAIEAECASPHIASTNIVSYEHVGCWADELDARAIDVMRNDLEDIEDCVYFCADDYEFCGVIEAFAAHSSNASNETNLMCFCTNSEADYQQYGVSDICNNGAGAQDMSTKATAMDVYKITVGEYISNDIDAVLGARTRRVSGGERERKEEDVELEPSLAPTAEPTSEPTIEPTAAEEESLEMADSAHKFVSDSSQSIVNVDVDPKNVNPAVNSAIDPESATPLDAGALENSKDRVAVNVPEPSVAPTSEPTSPRSGYVSAADLGEEIVSFFKRYLPWWSNEPEVEVEHAWMLMILLSFAMVICVVGLVRQCSADNEHTTIAGSVWPAYITIGSKVSSPLTPATYGSTAWNEGEETVWPKV